MGCPAAMEELVTAMQHPETGIKMGTQRFLVTPIPHLMTGHDIFEWLLQNLGTSEAVCCAGGLAGLLHVITNVPPHKIKTKLQTVVIKNHNAGSPRWELLQFPTQDRCTFYAYTVSQIKSFHLGDLIIKYGYIYPLKDPKSLVLRTDDSPYRFQTPYFWTSRKWPATDLDYAIYLAKKNIKKQGNLADYEKTCYNLLHTRINHAWDFVVMQASEQLRAAKQRKRSDRIVLDCQEQAYWLVNRPPPGALNIMDCGPHRNNIQARIKLIEYYNNALTRSRVKSSISLEGFVRHCDQYLLHDPIVNGCLPSNPWISNGTIYWTMNADLVAVPTRLRAERWALSIQELLQDPLGRQEFRRFLEKEISAENLSFWEACEDVCHGEQSKVEDKVEGIFEQFLAAGASKWVNVDSKTMEKTLDGLHAPHRYVLEDAQMHVYMLMKKDSYPRYLKSQMYKNLLASATVVQESKKRWHRLTNQIPSGQTSRPPPLDRRDKAATSTVSQLCRFSHPLANLGVFTGTNIPDYSKDEPSWSQSNVPTFYPGIFPTATSSPSCCSVDPQSGTVNETEVGVASPRFVQVEDASAVESRETSTQLDECGWNTRF